MKRCISTACAGLAVTVALVSCAFSSVGGDSSSSSYAVHIRRVTVTQNASATTTLIPDYSATLALDILNMNGISVVYTATWNDDGLFSALPSDSDSLTAGCQFTLASSSSASISFTPAQAAAGKDIVFHIAKCAPDQGLSFSTDTITLHVSALCTVTLDANGGTASSSSTLSGYEGASVSLSAGSIPSLTDYSFAGWNTKADGSGTPYTSGSSVLLSGDLTLYAQWVKSLATATTASATLSFIYNSDTASYYMSDYACTASTATALEIPATVNGIEVTALASGLFLNHTELTSVTIPATVTSIGDKAFYGCSSLSTVDLNDGLLSLGAYTFAGCTNISSLEIPATVASIGEYAFQDCTNLASMVVPSAVTTIGDYAFSGCAYLISMTMLHTASVPTLEGSNVFINCSTELEIRVSTVLYSQFMAATYWSSMTNLVAY